jgi:hypothetical protein
VLAACSVWVKRVVGKKGTGMRARIFKYADLSWKDLTNIKRWFTREEARDGFTLDSFNNLFVRVAKAENSVGQTICLTPIESCYVVGAFIQNPEATSIAMQRACDSIDVEIACLAQREGVTKFLIALPPHLPSEPGEKWIRVVQREVVLPVVMGGFPRSETTAARLN